MTILKLRDIYFINNKKISFIILFSIFFLFPVIVNSQSKKQLKEQVDAIDDKAQEYYNNKEFAKAVTEWIRALELDPENESIQLKVEMVYEEKHKKDIAYQKSKKYYYEAKEKLNQTTFKEGESLAVSALENFTIAYRIAPKDPELLAIKERMERLNQKLKVEREKNRISEEKLRKYNEFQLIADEAFKTEKYDIAVQNYDKMLEIIPKDIYALEQKRQAQIAIQNRLKWEKIKNFMNNASTYIAKKEYQQALSEYNQALAIDPQNEEVKEKIAEVNGIIEKVENAKRRREQADQFYNAGIDNLNENRFNSARDNFNNALALVENYPGARARLASIPALEKAYLEEVKKKKLQELDKEYRNGLFYYSQGNYQAALGSFERMLQINPESASAKEYLTKSKEALKQQREEVVDESSPYYNIINPLIISGKALFEKGKYQESLKRWNQITEIFPRNKIAGKYILMCQYKLNPDFYKTFAEDKIKEGQKLLKDKKYDSALYIFNIIKDVSPDYPGIDELIARSKREEKKFKAPKMSAARINTLYNQAIRLYQSGGTANINRAVQNLELILKNDPENFKASVALNRMRSELNIGIQRQQNTNVLSAQQQALVRKYYFNGINLYAKGRFREAIAEWRKVLAIDPKNVKAKNNIKRTMIILKD